MVQDTDMTDAAAAAAPKNEAAVDPSTESLKADAPSLPPLQASALRLERLLGGPKASAGTMESNYTNPVKIVRRWLATSSGAAADANAQDIKKAATALLDPSGPCAQGRRCLL
jgi:hypothetical protein